MIRLISQLFVFPFQLVGAIFLVLPVIRFVLNAVYDLMLLVHHVGRFIRMVVAPPNAPGAADDQDNDAVPPEPSAKQQADDELFFLRMLKPFTRYAPDVTALRDGPVRVRVAVGAASGAEVARRSAEALAAELGQQAIVLPSHHAGFMEDPAGFAAAVREVLAAP